MSACFGGMNLCTFPRCPYEQNLISVSFFINIIIYLFISIFFLETYQAIIRKIEVTLKYVTVFLKIVRIHYIYTGFKDSVSTPYYSEIIVRIQSLNVLTVKSSVTHSDLNCYLPS